MSEIAVLTTRWDELLERWSDRLNPVVVREVRQSFKNRIFLVVFFLLLFGCWLTSMFLILSYSNTIGQFEIGPLFYQWYLVGLIGCLIFAIPAGAFFSMVQEFRDKAFEVLAITSLTPQRIVWGKIQGAMVMMMIYASALAPFISLSYLLGGLGLINLFASLCFLFAVSLTMSMFGVMMGALSQKPWLEILNLLILLIASMVVAGISYGVSGDLVLRESMDLSGMLMGMLCFSLFLGFVALISLGVAQAQLTTTFLPLDYRRHVPTPARTPVIAQIGPRPPAASHPSN
ncbi:MAG TPA: hypothetical protein VLA12_19180 [Planctomycetaceae bacterium]|nr:hypothetical protein [Planctomycetaceae bacterium]